MAKLSRNDKCACGSGRKYKRCCLARGRGGRCQGHRMLVEMRMEEEGVRFLTPKGFHLPLAEQNRLIAEAFRRNLEASGRFDELAAEYGRDEVERSLQALEAQLSEYLPTVEESGGSRRVSE